MSSQGVDFLNVCKWRANAGGTADFVYSSARTGFVSPATAGVVDGTTYRYRAESDDLSQWEIGTGVYSTATNTIARTSITLSSTGSKVNFTAAPTVGLGTMFAADLRGTMATGGGTNDIAVKNSASNFDQKWITPAQLRINMGVREPLSAARTYYVRSDGSDSNDGLADSGGGAFLTLQKAINVVAGSIDFGANQVTIQVRGTGGTTFTGPLTLKNYVGGVAPIIIGDTTTPSNIILTYGSDDMITGQGIPPWTIRGFKLQTTSSGRNAVRMYRNSYLNLGDIEFSTVSGNHVYCDGGYVFVFTNCTISASPTGGFHVNAGGDGGVFRAAIAYTLSGSPVFSGAFVNASLTGLARFDSCSFTGSTGASSKRFSVSGQGVIYTAGQPEASFLPGDTAGTKSNNGLYL